MTIRNVIFSKANATFASMELARENLHSHQPVEFRQLVDNNDADLINRGIITEPVHWTWDQDAQTITVTRHVTNQEEYKQNRTWPVSTAIGYCTEAGWQFEGIEIIE